MMPDIDKVTAVIEAVGREIVAPAFGNLEPGDVRAKTGADDLVTIIDERTEKALQELLTPLAPDAVFIGEESVAEDPSLGEALSQEGTFWIVDPIDGTRNFVRGVPVFATIVAFVRKGETVAGWINAISEEKCAVAEHGAGVEFDGAAISPRRGSGALKGLRSIGWLDDEWSARIRQRLLVDLDTSSNHCSAYGYLQVANGEVDFKISSRIHAWDHAAGALMLQELGGQTRYLDKGGEPYRPTTSADRPLLATAPGRDWDAIAAKMGAR